MVAIMAEHGVWLVTACYGVVLTMPLAGVSMAALREMPLHSVLLTSGTLSPLESFAHELQLGFKFTLENPHVIQPNQVGICVGRAMVALSGSRSMVSNNALVLSIVLNCTHR